MSSAPGSRSARPVLSVVVAALLCLIVSGCLGDSDGVEVAGENLRVVRISVGGANVFVVDRGGRRIMIDSGNPGDEEEIESRMRARGVEPTSIDYLILTHGHVDHAGTAAHFRKKHGIKVIAGGGDAELIRNGGRGTVCPTSFLARAIRWMRGGLSYEPFEIDIPLEGDLDLASLGIEGKILYRPDHTPGSLVVSFDDQLFVGDLIRGGIVSPETPETHFFQCDLQRNRRTIGDLAEGGDWRRWYPGHFGPLSTDSVREYLASLG